MNTTMTKDYSIIHTNGHYEVYKNGKFHCSTDTIIEAVKEIDKEERKDE